MKVGEVVPEAMAQMEDWDARVEAIQLLIPLGLEAVAEELQRAVLELVGPRYQRKGSDQPLRRWGSQPGSCTSAIRKYLSSYRGCATWTTTQRSRCVPTRHDKHLGRWTRACCCGCVTFTTLTSAANHFVNYIA